MVKRIAFFFVMLLRLGMGVALLMFFVALLWAALLVSSAHAARLISDEPAAVGQIEITLDRAPFVESVTLVCEIVEIPCVVIAGAQLDATFFAFRCKADVHLCWRLFVSSVRRVASVTIGVNGVTFAPLPSPTVRSRRGSDFARDGVPDAGN